MIRPLFVVALATAALTAACGSESGSSATTTGPTTTAVATTTAAATTPLAPTTTAGATTTAAAAGIVPGADPEVDAVVTAYSTVFDSAVPFADKAKFLADAEALKATVEAYGAAGQRFGGISLQPTAVVITGDTAGVTYDVLFGTATQYSGQDGEAVRQAGTWMVSRDEFCSFMTAARTPCA